MTIPEIEVFGDPSRPRGAAPQDNSWRTNRRALIPRCSLSRPRLLAPAFSPPPCLCLLHARNPWFLPLPSLPVEVGKGHGFLHSIADSMRESSGMPRHDAPKQSVQLPEGEAPEPGTVDKIKASISGVAGASQVLGWGAQGSKPAKKHAEGTAPSFEAGADVSAPTLDASAAVPSVEGDVTVPSAEGGLTLPSGSADVGCELFLVSVYYLPCLVVTIANVPTPFFFLQTSYVRLASLLMMRMPRK